MSARPFDFKIGDRKCWAQGHPNKYPSVTLALNANSLFSGSFELSVSLTPAEARAMAVALEAAATHAENVLASGIGESAVDA